MSDYLDFHGKTLDEAIDSACNHYNVERGKLEIEIVHDAQKGFLGIFGAKKAVVRAKITQLGQFDIATGFSKSKSVSRTDSKYTNAGKSSQANHSKPSSSKFVAKQPARQSDNDADRAKYLDNSDKSKEQRSSLQAPVSKKQDDANSFQRKRTPRLERRPDNKNIEKKSPHLRAKSKFNPNQIGERNISERIEEQGSTKDILPINNEINTTRNEAQIVENTYPQTDLTVLDQVALKNNITDAIGTLAHCIIDDFSMDIEILQSKVVVRLDNIAESGLLIGKDGQTLVALQYLASCIVSRKMDSSIYVHIDIANYREHQDLKLKELALNLAAKVKAGKGTQSTKLLAAYQRRSIHMVLQDDPEIKTYSKGEGNLKRVVITLKKGQD